MIVVLDTGSLGSQYIADIVDNEMDVRIIPFLDLKKDDLNGVKGAILSGGTLLVTDIDTTPFLAPIALLEAAKIPILGISLGHQLLGLYFGAQASMLKPNNDWQIVEAFEESILFERLPQEVEMMKNHRETISIPPGFKLIAASDACVNEVMQHESKPYFGVQFQPELSGNHGAILIENFVRLCMREHDY